MVLNPPLALHILFWSPPAIVLFLPALQICAPPPPPMVFHPKSPANPPEIMCEIPPLIEDPWLLYISLHQPPAIITGLACRKVDTGKRF